MLKSNEDWQVKTVHLPILTTARMIKRAVESRNLYSEENDFFINKRLRPSPFIEELKFLTTWMGLLNPRTEDDITVWRQVVEFTIGLDDLVEEFTYSKSKEIEEFIEELNKEIHRFVEAVYWFYTNKK